MRYRYVVLEAISKDEYLQTGEEFVVEAETDAEANKAAQAYIEQLADEHPGTYGIQRLPDDD